MGVSIIIVPARKILETLPGTVCPQAETHWDDTRSSGQVLTGPITQAHLDILLEAQ